MSSIKQNKGDKIKAKEIEKANKIAIREMKKQEKIISKEIEKAEKIEIREIKKVITIYNKDKNRYDIVKAKITDMAKCVIDASTMYSDKNEKLYKIRLFYRQVVNIANDNYNRDIIASENAPTNKERRAMIKKARDTYYNATSGIIYERLNQAEKELKRASRYHDEVSYRFRFNNDKYEKIKAKYNSSYADVVTKMVYFEIGKKTNKDCASVVLSFL